MWPRRSLQKRYNCSREEGHVRVIGRLLPAFERNGRNRGPLKQICEGPVCFAGLFLTMLDQIRYERLICGRRESFMGNTLNWSPGKRRESLDTERIRCVSDEELYQLVGRVERSETRRQSSTHCRYGPHSNRHDKLIDSHSDKSLNAARV